MTTPKKRGRPRKTPVTPEQAKLLDMVIGPGDHYQVTPEPPPERRVAVIKDAPWPLEPIQEADPDQIKRFEATQEYRGIMEENMVLKLKVNALEEDNKRLTEEVALYEVKRENWMRATESQRLNALWKELDRARGIARELRKQIKS